MADITDEKLIYFRPDSLPGAEIFLAERSPRRWRMFHETYDVCICVRGPSAGTSWFYRGRSHTAFIGSVLLMEPGETHANGPVRALQDFKVLSVSPDVLENFARTLGLRSTPHFNVAQVDDTAFFRAFSRFHSRVDARESPLEQQSRLACCLHLLLDQCTETKLGTGPASQEERAVQRAKEYLHEHFAQKVTLDGLSAIAGLGAFRLLRSFEHRLGLPPHAYQLQLRVAKARVLLAAGMSLAVAAAELGFADQSHFGRHFKRIVGVPPGEYARGPAGSARTF
jgi:AraC-like DNA-binding protein